MRATVPFIARTVSIRPGPWWLKPLWSLRQQVEVNRMFSDGIGARHMIVNGDDLAHRATILDGEDIAEAVRVGLVGAEEPEVLVPLLEDVADHLAQLAGRFALLSGGGGERGGGCMGIGR